MRTVFAAVPAALLLFAGCAPGRDDDLKQLVDDVAPAGAQLLGCGWEKRWGSDAGSFYDCYYVIPGRPRDIGRLVLARIAGHGFVVSCRTTRGVVELLGARDGGMFYAGVVARTAAAGGAAGVSRADIPQGYVLVELAATKDKNAGILPGTRICASPS
jgi:hypothetical protein